ncbi:type I restriction-modification system subunit M N-terminal domain-containing protein [Heyndrickxia sporothermodurans]
MALHLLKQILLKSKKILGDENLSVIIELLVFKYLNDQFEKERNEIRQDFLLRGICSNEVNGLVEEETLYQMYFIPKTCRWNFFKSIIIKDEINFKKIIVQIFELNRKNTKRQIPTINKVSHFQMRQIIELVDMFDFSFKSDIEKEAVIFTINEWGVKNNLDVSLLKQIH